MPFGTAGELRVFSSCFTELASAGLGDPTATEALFALSSWSSFSAGVDEVVVQLKGFFLVVPFCSVLSPCDPLV